MRRLSLAGQLLLLQMGIVVMVVLAVAVVSAVQADAEFKRSESRRMLSSAEAIASNDIVRQELSEGNAVEAVRIMAETGRAYSGADYVLVVDVSGQVRTTTIPLPASSTFDFGDSNVHEVVAWTGVSKRYGDDSIEAHVPVLSAATGEAGKLLGYVVVGVDYPSWWQVMGTAAPDVLLYLALAGIIGIIGSLLLARRVKRQTLGLEPREITALVEQREAMLHGVREGVVGVDLHGRVTFANDEARRLLTLPDSPVGRPVGELGHQPEVIRILLGEGQVTDAVAAVASRLVVFNNMPVTVRGRRTGSVTTMRDRTELLDLQHQLVVAQDGSDTLRAQVHEFRNRLHAIAGMAELGERQELLAFIGSVAHGMDQQVEEVASRVEDPAVAALLVAKSSRARELLVDFSLEEEAHLRRHHPELSTDLVTVTGNLIDNAFEAVGPGGGSVTVDLSDDGRAIRVTVSDSGQGIDPSLVSQVFQPGWTSKTGDDVQAHGWGLALTRMACQRHGGDVAVRSATGSEIVATLYDTSSEPAREASLT